MSDLNELLACPFCGGGPRMDAPLAMRPLVSVCCGECAGELCVTTEYMERAEAIAAWNTRATAPTLTGDGGDGESAGAQIDRLATFILQNVPGEPSQNQGAVDTAIRLIDASLAAQHGEGSANVS